MKLTSGTIRPYKAVSADIAILFTSILLLIYTVYRAASLSFTIDESQSFNDYIHSGFMDIISYKNVTANNHILNTLAMKYLNALFGGSEWVLRLPAILAHVQFLFITRLIARKVTLSWMVFPAFLLLNMNPYLLDYFSMARGYAVSLACCMTSLYLLLEYAGNRRKLPLIWSLIFGALAVLGNFTTLIYFASLLILLNLIFLSETGLQSSMLLRKNIPLFIVSLILGAICFEPIRKLKEYNGMYDGGHNGFWSDTVSSLIEAMRYGKYNYPWIQGIMKAGILLIFGGLGAGCSYLIARGRKDLLREPFVISFLLISLCVLVSMLQHYLLHTLYPINRMILFLPPLFLAALFFYPSILPVSGPGKKIIGGMIWLFAGTCTVHTISAMNVLVVFTAPFDADTRTMMKDLDECVKRDKKSSVSLGTSWIFENTIRFYATTQNYSWLNQTVKNPGAIPCDYYYLTAADKAKSPVPFSSVIKYYPRAGAYLLKQ